MDERIPTFKKRSLHLGFSDTCIGVIVSPPVLTPNLDHDPLSLSVVTVTNLPLLLGSIGDGESVGPSVGEVGLSSLRQTVPP